MSRRSNEFEIEQTIFLGGQISDKHKIYQKIAMMSPDYAIIYVLLDNLERLNSMSYEEAIKELIMLLGQVDMIRSTSELTKLSMIMGDTRKRYSMKGLKDELARAINETPQS